MMKSKIFPALLLAGLTAHTALYGLDVPVPFNPQQIAAKANRQSLPTGLSVSAEGKALKITAAAGVELAEAVTLSQSVDVPRQAAGRDATVLIRLSGRGLKTGNTTTFAVGGRKIPLPQGDFNGKTVSAKIKCPADGKLPVTICLRDFAGALTIQEPAVRIAIPNQLPANLKQKRKLR